MKKFVAVAILTVVFMAGTAVAGQKEPEAAEALLKRSIEAVFVVLEEPGLTEDEQQERIEAIVDPVFDYELIARLSLGPRNWHRLDSEQKAIFIERFVSRLKESYFENIAMYQGDADAEVSSGGAKQEGTRVHVPVRAGMDDSSVDMLYKFHLSEQKGWQVYDVEINGVSIVASYRSQFNQVLQASTVDEMLEQLKIIEAPMAP